MLDVKGFNQLCKAKHGYFLYNKNDVYVGKALAAYGEWSEPEVELFGRLCRTGDTVIEAGSNIGTHTVPLAKMVGTTGTVHAFEPQMVVFQNLCANIALNSLTNVDCHNVAIGAENGEVFIPRYSYDKPNNFGGVKANKFTEGRKTPKVSLDSYLVLKQLRLIKADIEGMEYELLRGGEKLIDKFLPIIYLESELEGEMTQNISKFLSEKGYELFWHRPDLFNPQNYAENKENIFGNYASFNLLCIPQAEIGNISLDNIKLTPDDS